MNKDLEHLKMLSIGFYIYSAITAIFACLPFIHLFMGIAMISGAFDGDKNPPPAFVGWLFVGIGGIFIILGWATAICTFFAGKYIKQQTHYIFCFVMVAINCMFAPLGTILGVFAIIVLLRDSVKELFNGQSVQSNYQPQSWQQ
jgi:hypothetical protein